MSIISIHVQCSHCLSFLNYWQYIIIVMVVSLSDLKFTYKKKLSMIYILGLIVS